jgi:hypothetical protein
MLVERRSQLFRISAACCVECSLVKNRSSHLNFFDLGAKFVERSIGEMFDVVSDMIDSSASSFRHPPFNRNLTTIAAPSPEKVEAAKSASAHTTH